MMIQIVEQSFCSDVGAAGEVASSPHGHYISLYYCSIYPLQQTAEPDWLYTVVNNNVRDYPRRAAPRPRRVQVGQGEDEGHHQGASLWNIRRLQDLQDREDPQHRPLAPVRAEEEEHQAREQQRCKREMALPRHKRGGGHLAGWLPR